MPYAHIKIQDWKSEKTQYNVKCRLTATVYCYFLKEKTIMRLTLTQFITYKLNVSTSARIHYLRKIKEGSDYSPYKDYWRQLRNAVSEVASGTRDLDYLRVVAENADSRHKSNYYKDASRLINFISNNNVSFMPISKAQWNYLNLTVTASPEIGMRIHEKDYAVKIYYKVKKPTERWLKNNIPPMLSIMRRASPEETKTFAILNLQNGKLYTEDKYKTDMLELEIDAQTLLDIWNRI